MISVAQS